MDEQQKVTNQVLRMLGKLVEHASTFGMGLTKQERQWVIQNPSEAITIFCLGVIHRTKKIPDPRDFVDFGRFPERPGSNYAVQEHETYHYEKWKCSLERDHGVYLYCKADAAHYGINLETVDDLRNRIKQHGGGMPSTVLDYLIPHSFGGPGYEGNRSKIPEEWRGKRIHFLGTVFKDQHDTRWVACLDWADEDRPFRRWIKLDDRCNDNDYAVLFVSGGW